jgi:hypothetical protein
MKLINPAYLNPEKVAQLQAEFQQAQPYKHIVLDNFLDEKFANLLHDNFPSIDKLNKHYKGLNEHLSLIHI